MTTQVCKQCNTEKDIGLFRKVTNQYTGVHPMSICKDCYKSNQDARKLQEAQEMEAFRVRRIMQEQQQRQREEEQRRRETLHRQIEEKRLKQQNDWVKLQPDRQCITCQQKLPATAFPCQRSRRGEYVLHDQCITCAEEEKRRKIEEKKRCRHCQSMFAINDYGWLCVPWQETDASRCYFCGNWLTSKQQPDGSAVYQCSSDWFHTAGVSQSGYYYGTGTLCPRCHYSYRKKNRQANPLCPMCGTPTCVWDFLREYRGYRLDLIKVCCETCIQEFNAFPEAEQIRRLRKAMKNAYGESAIIYALHYDTSDAVHHIGRTKHFTRRMAEYRRNWDKPIHHYSVLEDVTPGALSMERESRWIMHALKHGWPIDNFELQQGGEDGLSGLHIQNELILALACIEPLTAPFETIEPLLKYFSNTMDTRIVHWVLTQM